jgi:hypothetical protein
MRQAAWVKQNYATPTKLPCIQKDYVPSNTAGFLLATFVSVTFGK